MAGQAVIGALRAVFGADTAAFEKGTDKVQRKLKQTQRKFEKFGSRLSSIGKNLSVGITAPLAFLGVASVKAGIQHAEAMAQVEAGLLSMGAASGKSLDGLKKNALQLESLSSFNADEVLQKVTANMLTFGNVSGDVFDRAQMSALDLSTRLDQDLKTSTIAIGKALNDPVLGLTALSRVGIQFTQDQKDLVKGMVEAGDVAGAQGIILDELEKQYRGSAKAARDAAPGSDLIDANRKFKRIIGEIALEVLPPLTDILTNLLTKFNELEPGVQRNIVKAAALAAALGPVIAVVGAVISAAAPLLALLGSLAGAAGFAGLGAAALAVITPIGAVVGVITALVVAYKTLAPALKDNKKARDELYSLINENMALGEQEKATTLAGAKANLQEAQSIRERIKARLEEQEALLSKQVNGFVALQTTQAGRSLGGLFGVDDKILGNIQKTGMAVKDARQALEENERATMNLQAQYDLLAGSQSDVENSSRSLTAAEVEAIAAKKKARGEAAKAAAEMKEEKKKLIQSTADELESNRLLSEALQVSEREYEIVTEKLRLLREEVGLTDEEARSMATALVDSRDSLAGVREESERNKQALEDSRQAAKDYADQIAETAMQAIEDHENAVGAIERELEVNKMLADALRISQKEYEITAEKIRILESAFSGTEEEARAMAEKLIVSRETLGDLGEEARKAEDALKKTGDAGIKAFEGTLGSVEGLINGIKDGDLEGILQGALGLLDQIFGFSSGGASSGGGFGNIVSGIGSLFGGFREDGGPVSKDVSYVVGEKRPELFTPTRDGYIHPSAQNMGGMVEVSVVANEYFDARVDQRAAGVAAPIAQVSTVQGVSTYNRNVTQQNRQRLA